MLTATGRYISGSIAEHARIVVNNLTETGEYAPTAPNAGGAVAGGSAAFATDVYLLAGLGAVAGGEALTSTGWGIIGIGGGIASGDAGITTGYGIISTAGGLAGGGAVFLKQSAFTASGGAVASGTSKQFGTFYAPPVAAIYASDKRYTLQPLTVSSVQSDSALASIATTVTIRYGYDWQAGDYTGSVTYTAPEQVKQFGSIERIIEAPFCATARQASRLAEYWTQRLSVPQYTATIETDRSNRHVQVADRISLVHPHLPGGSADGALVTGREYNPETGALTLFALLPSTTLPAVQLSGYAGKFTQKAPAGTKVSIGNGTIDLIIADDNGTVLAGAMATLDGTATTTADASGRVLFTGVAKGEHTIEVRANGYEAFTLQVSV